LLQSEKEEQGKGEIVPSLVTLAGHIERGARHRIGRKRGSGEGRTTGLLWHMRWRVWLGNIMEMYRTANPGMTVRPRPWPRGVASSTELLSIKWHLSSGAGRRGLSFVRDPKTEGPQRCNMSCRAEELEERRRAAQLPRRGLSCLATVAFAKEPGSSARPLKCSRCSLLLLSLVQHFSR
jgi:hypothetical protein